MARSAVRVIDFGYFMVDLDLGEFFLNFPYPELFREYSGIDLTPFAETLASLGFTLIPHEDGLFKV